MNLLGAIENNNRWYRNCKNVRKRNGKICKECPFIQQIKEMENTVKKESDEL